MPLDFVLLSKQLTNKAKMFQQFDKDISDELNSLNAAAPAIFTMNYDDLVLELHNSTKPVGAIPTDEFKHGLLVEFPFTFSNLHDMLKWAMDTIKDNITVGTDGSQIYSSQDISVPVAVVQTVTYINEHSTKAKSYDILRDIDILTPSDLMQKDKLGTTAVRDEPVNVRRFEMEMGMLRTQMEEFKNSQTPEIPAYFFSDGSLILSFLQIFERSSQKRHLDALKSALDKSKETESPLIGFIDTSDAKDVIGMMKALNNKLSQEIKTLSDSYILENYIGSKNGLNKPMKWGDRTCTFVCDRNDEIYVNYSKTVGHKIAFFYIKLCDNALSRVEFPIWILEKMGLVEKIADIFRAESAIGSGYPYTIDQCHQRTVISVDDKMKFQRIFMSFLEKSQLKVKIRNKSRSKMVHG
jgi:hypothetical protein